MANDLVLGNPINPAPAPAPALTLGSPVPDTALAPETIIGKGQLPRQLTVGEQRDWAAFDLISKKQRAMQADLADERAGILQPSPYSPWPLNKIIPAASPFIRSGARELGDAALGAPSFIANTMNAVPRAVLGAVAPSLAPTLTPQVPQPTFNDALALIKSATSPMTFDEAKSALGTGQQAMETVYPNVTAAGKIGGDVATVVGPRALMAEDLVRGYTNSPDARRLLAYTQGAGEGALEQAKATWAQPWFQRLRRGLGKVGETGLEQGMLTALHGGGSPLVNGAVAGGLQLAGNAALTPLVMLPKTSAAAATLFTGVLATSIYNDWIPGGKTNFMANLNDTIKGLGWGSAIGLGATLAGAGRYRGSGEPFGAGAVVGGTRPAFFHHEFARRVPALAESINAAVRTVPNSIIRMILSDQKSSNPVIVPTLSQIATRGENFTPKELDMLGRGIQNNDARGTIQRMLKDQTLVDPNGATFAERMAQ